MKQRAVTTEDLGAIAELFGAVEEMASGRPSHADADEVRGWLGSLPLDTNSWVLEEDGRIVAVSFAQRHGDRGTFAGAVRPSAQGRGLGAQIAELAESRLAEEGAPRAHGWTVAGDEAASKLFQERGYREVRRFWEMAIDLDGEIPEPAVEIETFDEKDARLFHAALEEAFADHWEHHAETFDEWWSRQHTQPGYDPTLWFLVRDGEEMAAVCRNDANRSGGGFVGALGVRRPWRGRGYGRALLRHSFREFKRRGSTTASLGVDSSNPTGATRLYESVGMHVRLENIVWEKLLG
ncbi:MAG TPA: GNAT family N-acetyltransferase [Acidimicrobiales bacterium]|nr:GNAT family N-acetyltransferase [Acidimicrobiales bacterium]